METKELAAIIFAAVTVTVSILGWMEVRFASKGDLEFMYIETQMGINDLRLKSYENIGLRELSDSDKRVYTGLVEAQKSLQLRRGL